MNDDELLRYSRHILLDDIGIEGQERFRGAHVLIVGAGGLGCAAALYLGAAGVGHLILADDDTVDATNLQRQVAHTADRVGMPKVESLAQAIAAINPLVRTEVVARRADAPWLAQALPGVDLVLDCCDNFHTRQLINSACVAARKPLVSGAAIAMDGQLALYDPRRADSPCYACVFPPDAAVEEVACATMGVFAPLVGMVGTAQAALALQVLLADVATAEGRKPPAAALPGSLRMLDARAIDWSTLRVARDPHCPVCGAGAARISG
ncbi:molybdopterin-synthase adenylyltransferase MoeB [Xylophilus rhododendri]|uniref:Molybdopterin-synthase adenylyltransferase MoeB n=1 Tax=Xylophilus rhododendri TaxID=2697032 RepID=A0A857J8Q4_9BURK|nr:molybdopterin-synthase adenylyltransferase MoeB [Xylophilus rhododendri]QHI99429.1 molybdopterin-synthase adenylyltransferase MoeB [Xylophilus rhododendri]